MAAPIWPRPMILSVLQIHPYQIVQSNTVRFPLPCLVHASSWNLRAALKSKPKQIGGGFGKTCMGICQPDFFDLDNSHHNCRQQRRRSK